VDDFRQRVKAHIEIQYVSLPKDKLPRNEVYVYGTGFLVEHIRSVAAGVVAVAAAEERDVKPGEPARAVIGHPSTWMGTCVLCPN
jgi:hypothetical protein